MVKDIYILGSGGFAKEVAFLIEYINNVRTKKWNIIGYIDKKEFKGKENGKYKVILSDEELIDTNKQINVVIGIGNPKICYRVITYLKSNNKIIFPNIIFPKTVGDWNDIILGEGNIITANNIFTTNIKIGSFNIFNLNCTVGHDVIIGNFNVFNPSVNISGNVAIGNNNLFGTGSKIIQNLEIGNGVVIGAGGVVVKDIIESGTYVGIPVKRIK